MTERELFAAYRVTVPEVGYASECACGELIESRLGTEEAIREALALHYATAIHQQWSEWQEAVHALQRPRPTRKPCPCHEHSA